MTEPWRPPSARSKTDTRFDGLHEGIPEWILEPLRRLLANAFIIDRDAPSREQTFDESKVEKAQIALRLLLPKRTVTITARSQAKLFVHEVALNHDLSLDLVDFLLHQGLIEAEDINELANILERGGSGWTVERSSSVVYLSRRVGPSVAEGAHQVIEGAGASAGTHLEAAWPHIYGRPPDPTAGYNEAVKAIEAEICPVVIPADSSGTLGKAISALRNAPEEKFTVVLMGPEDPLAHVRGLCELVWQSQVRHGQSDPSAKRDHTPEEAEMALHAALTLVHWFSKGLVRATKS